MSAPFPSTYSVQQHQGKPVFAADGRPVTLPSYCGCGPAWGEVWKAACRRFVRHGCRIFWLMPTGGYNGEWGTTPFWTGPGQIHSPPLPMPDTYIGLDQQARTFIDLTPEARFFVRMMDLPPASWGQAYPDHMLLNCDGHRYESASLASDRYLDELRRFLQALTRHCEAADWAERVIGYVIYPLGEGATQLACEGYLFDQSPVMQQAFRGFLRRKYGTDAALREAWSDPKVTLETAAVLGDADFRRRDPSVRFWPEARQVQPERDYFDCQRPLFRRYVRTMIEAFRAVAGPGKLCGFDGLKGNMLGWMTHPVFSGGKWKEHYGDQFLATGTTGMAEILDWPELDLIATPHDYRCRWVGFGYDPEGIGDSVYLHGKVMFTEEDQRSHANSERGLFGSLEPGEEEAVLYRNLVASLSKGHQTYPMDVCVGYFEDDGIQRLLARRRDIEADFLDRPRADVPSVVMLVDDQAAAYTDFSAEYNDLAVIRQRIHGMNHCGVPTRTFLWDDLLRDNFPACHRLFLLPNCYRSDDATLARLREKLFRSGNVVVFGPGSGITDGTTVSPDFAVRLLGLPFELYDYDYPRFVTLDNPGRRAVHPPRHHRPGQRQAPARAGRQGIRPWRCRQRPPRTPRTRRLRRRLYCRGPAAVPVPPQPGPLQRHTRLRRRGRRRLRRHLNGRRPRGQARSPRHPPAGPVPRARRCERQVPPACDRGHPLPCHRAGDAVVHAFDLLTRRPPE
jgi:hypothetical protein